MIEQIIVTAVALGLLLYGGLTKNAPVYIAAPLIFLAEGIYLATLDTPYSFVTSIVYCAGSAVIAIVCSITIGSWNQEIESNDG